MPTDTLSPTRLRRVHDVLSDHVARGEVPGLVAMVSRRGETHVDAIGVQTYGAAEPMRRDTIFRIASMSKPITAVAAMILVEECRLRLDDPVDALLPELANRRVLRAVDSPLDDTVPANRPVTLRDLLTFRLGIGTVLAPPGSYPIQIAMKDAGIDTWPFPVSRPPDEYMRSLGALPLIHPPGEAWMYHTSADVLGVLIARASGQTFGAFLHDRLFEPLGMKDTAFHVPAAKLDRLPPTYWKDPATGTLGVLDSRNGRWSRPPVFESGGRGLVSTADDYLAFLQMMLSKGRHGRERILSRPSVELMTMDHLTPEQKASPDYLAGDGAGWGFGMAVDTRRSDLWAVPGRFGWDGSYGTSAHADPREDMIGVLMRQRLIDSLVPNAAYRDFWTSAYQAIDD